MPINLIEHNDIDRLKWDNLVDADANSLIFAKSWYLDAVDPNWCAYVADDYTGALPISKSKKGGVGHLYLPFFVRELNSIGKLDESLLRKKVNSDFKRISIASSNLKAHDDWQIQESRYQLIDLCQNHDELQSKYSNNAKRSIKKAQKNFCELRRSHDTNWIVDGFKSGKGKLIKSLDSSSYDILTRLMSALRINNAMDVFEIWSGDEKMAAACFMKHKGRITYLKGHVTDIGKSMGAMYFLFDCALKAYCPNYEIFDFGGSKVDSVAEFYKKFGAIDSNYLFLKKDSSPKIHQVARMLRSKIKKK